MRDTIGELCVQTRNATTYGNNILCILILVTRKLEVVCRRSTYPMTALQSEMSFSVSELDAKYQWRGTPPNTHRSLFPKSHFAYTVQLDIQLENFSSYVEV